MAFQRITLGIQIEGIGDTSGLETLLGTMFSTSPISNPAAPLHNYEWSAVLAAVPASISSRVDPFTGDFDLSAFTFELQATPDVIARLIPIQRIAPGSLFAALPSGSASMFTSPPGQFAAGDLVWIEDETIRLSALLGTTADRDQWLVVRQVCESDETDHGAGVEVYSKPPYMRGRVVKLFRMFDESAPVVIWAGVLDNVQTDATQTILKLVCVELLRQLTTARGNTAIRTFQRGTRDLESNYNGESIGGSLSVPVGHVRVLPNYSFAYVIGEIEGATYIFKGIYFPGLEGLRVGEIIDLGGGNYQMTKNAPVLLGGPITRDGEIYDGALDTWRVQSGSSFREIIFSRRDLDENTFSVIPNEWHPLSIALCFLASTGTGQNNLPDPAGPGFLNYDVLAHDLGLGFPRDRIDVASFVDLIAETADLKIDQLILGESGELSLLDIVRDMLLRPYNFFLAQDDQGRLAARKLELFGVQAISRMLALDNSILIPMDIGLDLRQSSAVRTVSATVGESPFSPGQEFSTSVSGNTRSDRLISNGRGTSFDFSTVLQQNFESVIINLANKAKLRADNPPVMSATYYWIHEETVGGVTGGEVPALGKWIRVFSGISEITLIGPDGTRIDPNLEDNWIVLTGLITGVRMDLNQYTKTLEVLLSWRQLNVPRFIAPNAVVLSYGFDLGEFYFEFDPAELPSIDGSVGFEVGDEIAVHYLDGMVRWEGDEVKEITTIDVVLNRIYIGAVNYTAGNPPAGVLLRLSDVTSFSNSGWANGLIPAAFASRRYTYAADSSQQVGPPAVTGDVYGLD